MPRLFIKTRDCGCIVEAMLCGIETTDRGKMYLIGSHNQITICDKCKQDEENEIDTLYDMWMSDNITDDFGLLGWREK